METNIRIFPSTAEKDAVAILSMGLNSPFLREQEKEEIRKIIRKLKRTAPTGVE